TFWILALIARHAPCPTRMRRSWPRHADGRGLRWARERLRRESIRRLFLQHLSLNRAVQATYGFVKVRSTAPENTNRPAAPSIPSYLVNAGGSCRSLEQSET